MKSPCSTRWESRSRISRAHGWSSSGHSRSASGRRSTSRHWAPLAWIASCVLAAGCGNGAAINSLEKAAQSAPSPQISALLPLSHDIFTNSTSQHATEVEPDAAVFGSTIVAAFQSGRFFDAGSSDLAFATSHDGGATWTDGVLPDTTNIETPGAPFDSISDPSVAYDAAHAVWLIAGLPIIFSGAPAPAVVVSRSSDGINFGAPVAIAPGQISTDKDWITCDDSPGSPFYGRCYVEFDNLAENGLIEMCTSTDGGQTWGTPLTTADDASGIGGQPLVQPNGTVVVPIDDSFEANVLSFVSTTGGASWSASVLVSPISDHLDAGGLRSAPLPSAATDAAGTVYLVWQDCRYRTDCEENDIVLSTSSDGLTWTPPARVPIDAPTSTVDHFLPGIRISPMTAGPSAEIGITYFFYPQTSCSVSTCQLDTGFISSQDGGNTWSTPAFLAGPSQLGWLPQTAGGLMVGDYTTTIFANGVPLGIFAVAHAPTSELNEAMYVTKLGVLSRLQGRRSSFGERPVPGAHSDHPQRIPPPPQSMRVLADPLGGD
ncbi:MAG TPA: sialidase family protein [Candidatus Acidoferrales bacterium]|nr:sialidase family protein [Candidatus Acidoferrales bacterium]